MQDVARMNPELLLVVEIVWAVVSVVVLAIAWRRL